MSVQCIDIIALFSWKLSPAFNIQLPASLRKCFNTQESFLSVLYFRYFPSESLKLFWLYLTVFKAKSKKYQGIFKVKSRVKTWQVRGIWSQPLEHKQVPQRGTEPGVRKGKHSLLASHTSCKCSMETTHNSVKLKLGVKVMKMVESLIG